MTRTRAEFLARMREVGETYTAPVRTPGAEEMLAKEAEEWAPLRKTANTAMLDGPMRAEEMLGQRVRAYRQAKQWSQKDLAERMQAAGFSWLQSTVAKTEAAERPVRVGEAAALAAVFEMSIDSLICDKPDLTADRMRSLQFSRRLLLSKRVAALTRIDEIDVEISIINQKIDMLAREGQR